MTKPYNSISLSEASNVSADPLSVKQVNDSNEPIITSSELIDSAQEDYSADEWLDYLSDKSLLDIPDGPEIDFDGLRDDWFIDIGEYGGDANDPGVFDDSVINWLPIATDSEWDSSYTYREQRWVCSTFATDGYRFSFWNSFYPDEIKKRLYDHGTSKGHIVKFFTMTPKLRLLDEVIKHLARSGVDTRHIDIPFYFSGLDPEYALSWRYMLSLYLSERVKRDRIYRHSRSLRFSNSTKIRLRDLSGWSSEDLKSLADACNVAMPSKSVMDEYKSCMHDGVLAHPEAAYDYAMGDSEATLQIYSEFPKCMEWVQREVIGLSEDNVLTRDQLPQTLGSLMSKFLLGFLSESTPNKIALVFCFRKLGLLDASDPKHRENTIIFNEVCKKYHTIEAIEEASLDLEKHPELDGFLNHCKFEFSAISQASIKYFAGQKLDSSAFNALVQGGRCNNEAPLSATIKIGADVDFSSCYGDGLRKFVYPLGLPTVFSWPPNEVRPKLGKFLGSKKNKFADDIFTITVSGLLKKQQDLIYSKYVTQLQINNASSGGWEKTITDVDRDDDVAHIPGEFVLSRYQIENSILTSDVLKTVLAVCTEEERNGLMNLEVVTAAGYLLKDRVDTVDEWIEIVLKDKGKILNKGGLHHKRNDTRTRKWVGIPLEGFIGRMVDVRRELKNFVSDDPVEMAQAKGRQLLLKALITCLYGVLASPYLPVGNTILANCITARARCQVWMLNKALHTRQTVTDGGFYSVNSVPFFKDGAKKAGLAALADNSSWTIDPRKTRYLAPLGGIDWNARYKELAGDGNPSDADLRAFAKELDDLVTKHFSEFWSVYKLPLRFKIEHKWEHTFYRAAYFLKAHYALQTLKIHFPEEEAVEDRNIIYKIRGAKLFSDSDKKSHPTHRLLKNLLMGIDEFPKDLEYHHREHLSIKKCLEDLPNSTDYYNDDRPGDFIYSTRNARYNNLHFPIKDKADFNSRNKRTTRKGVALFEQIGREKGIAAMVEAMAENKLRSTKYKP